MQIVKNFDKEINQNNQIFFIFQMQTFSLIFFFYRLLNNNAKISKQRKMKRSSKKKSKNLQVNVKINEAIFQDSHHNLNNKLREEDEYSNQNQSQMLVSISQTERFKLDFLVSSYQELIQRFKQNHKDFSQSMKRQSQRHHFYYSEIQKYVHKIQQRTLKQLRQRIQDVSNIFRLKISCLEMKLRAIAKVLYEDVSQCNDQFKRNKIRNPRHQDKKDSQANSIGEKASSYQYGLDFDYQLKQFYVQKNFKLEMDFIQNQKVQESLQDIRQLLVKDWQNKQNSSFSFSSAEDPQIFKQNIYSDELYPPSKLIKINRIYQKATKNNNILYRDQGFQQIDKEVFLNFQTSTQKSTAVKSVRQKAGLTNQQESKNENQNMFEEGYPATNQFYLNKL